MKSASPRNALAFLGDKLQVSHWRWRRLVDGRWCRHSTRRNFADVDCRLGVTRLFWRSTGNRNMHLYDRKGFIAQRATLRFWRNNRKSRLLSSTTIRTQANGHLSRLLHRYSTSALLTHYCTVYLRTAPFTVAYFLLGSASCRPQLLCLFAAPVLLASQPFSRAWTQQQLSSKTPDGHVSVLRPEQSNS